MSIQNQCQLAAGKPVNKAGHVKIGKKFAHRLAYEAVYGPIPTGMCVCHRCDNPRCVNPGHLFLGTQKDNMQDMVIKSRSTKGERNRHAKLTTCQVAQIRYLYALGNFTQQELADAYRVNNSNINRLLSRKQWA